MSTCPQCGQENRDDARFCIKCGGQLEAPAQPEPPQQAEAPAAGAEAVTPPPAPPPPAAPLMPPQAPPPPTPPPQAAPTATQPAAPAAYPPPTPPGGYTPAQPTAPQAAAYPPAQPAYGERTGTRKPVFWIGAGLVLIAGVLVLISTWLTWGSGPYGVITLSGWDWFDIGRTGVSVPGGVANAFFVYSEGLPIFTGLCSLIAGGLIILMGLLMLAFRSKGMGVVVIIISILAFGMAVTNLTTILRTEGISVGIGMYLFVIFSFLGIVGGGMGMAG